MSRFAGLQGPPLHQAVMETRRQHARSEHELIQALVAVERTKLHLQMRCTTAVGYGSRYLNLEPQKAREFLRVGRMLPKFPLLAQVVEKGLLHWSKIREITRVMTPENEQALIEYAMDHLSHVVQRMVACRPRHARKVAANVRAAATAARGDSNSRAGVGGATSPAAVAGGAGAALSPPAAAEGVETGNSAEAARAGAEPAPGVLPANASSSGAVRARLATGAPVAVAAPEQEDLFGQPLAGTQSDEPPVKPQEILYDMRLSVLQWAKQEQVNNRICSRLGFRANRARIQEEMCDICLSVGDVRTQIRYQVYVHVDGITGEGWLDTERGFLPAPREVVADALARGRVTEVTRESVPGWGWRNRLHVVPAGAGEAGAVDVASSEIPTSEVATVSGRCRNQTNVPAQDDRGSVGEPSGEEAQTGVRGDDGLGAGRDHAGGEETSGGHADLGLGATDQAAVVEESANDAARADLGSVGAASGEDEGTGDHMEDAPGTAAPTARDAAVQELARRAGSDRETSGVPASVPVVSTRGAQTHEREHDHSERVPARRNDRPGTHQEGAAPAPGETAMPMEANNRSRRSSQDGAGTPDGGPRESPHKRPRKKIPVATMRKLLEESEGRCVDCGSRLRVQFNHKDRPYSETPEHDPITMDNRCDECHAAFHLEDYRARPAWRAARERAIRARRAQRLSTSEREDPP